MIATLGLSMMVVSLLVVGFVFVSVMLILVILIQRPTGGGLSGAFGAGAGSGQTAFGAKTGDALTIATVFMFILFLGVAIGLGFMTRPQVATPAQPTITSTSIPADDQTGDGGETTPIDVTPVVPADDTPTDDGDVDGVPAETPAEEPTPPGDGG